MASSFNLLTAGGARFDKVKYKHDHALFNKPAKRPRRSSDGHRESKTGTLAMKAKALPPGLNVFSDPSSSTSRTAPITAPAQPDDMGAESDSDSDSGSSSSSRPRPPAQKITISGPDPLPSSLRPNLPSLTSHPSRPLSSASGRPLLRALEAAGIRSLWGVQCAVAGCLLQGADVLCVAPTGSGKTLAYVLPTLVAMQDPASRLRSREGPVFSDADAGGRGEGSGQGVRAVILVPTHDLAVQIQNVVKAVTAGRAWRVILLSKATEKAVCESAPGQATSTATTEAAVREEEEKESSSTLGIDILISTPERLHHLVENGRMSLSSTRHLIMDEADRLLSADFLPQVEPIVKACQGAQKCLLSATIPAGAESLARGWLKDGGVRIVVGVKDSAVSTVTQSLTYTSSESGKLLALRSLLLSGGLPYPSLIFVQSIERADELYRQISLDPDLDGLGVRVGVVHGAKSNKARDEVVQGFREGTVWVLVVTEVMARGMDFGGVKVVLNYDFPQTVQSYIHRIGRTGRAGRQGKAITFVNSEDAPYLRTIANVLVASGCPVPDYMLSLPKPSKNLKRHLAKAPLKRKVVGGGGRDLAKEERRKRADMKRGSKRRGAKSEPEARHQPAEP